MSSSSKALKDTAIPHLPLRDLITALAIALQTDHVPLIWGLPGVGKTATLEALAKRFDRTFYPVLGSIHEPVDILGFPVIVDGALERSPEPWVRELMSRAGSVLFDDLTTISPAMMGAFLQVIQKKRIGPHDLSNCQFAAAANPPHITPDGRDLAAPLANPIAHFNFHMTTQEWSAGRRAGFPLPDVPTLPSDWKATQLPRIVGVVTGFLERTGAEFFHKMPDDPIQQGRAWPSGRTWDMAMDLLAAALSVNANTSIQLELVSGCVGPAAATSLMTFIANFDLPDPEQLLRAGNKAKLPAKQDAIYVTFGALVAAVLANNTSQRWKTAFDVLELGKVDMAGIFVRELLANRPKDLDLDETLLKKFTRYGVLA